MLDTKRNMESGYIGEEFFTEPEKARLHRCLVVEQAISEGYFSFDQALAAFEMDREEYEQYIARKSSDVIMYSISSLTFAFEAKFSQPAFFEIFAKMIGNSSMAGDIDEKVEKELKGIAKKLRGISKEIDENRSGRKEKA